MWIRKESAGKAQKRVFFTICTVIVGFPSNEDIDKVLDVLCDVFHVKCGVLIYVYIFERVYYNMLKI
jgi:hypothetical protein